MLLPLIVITVYTVLGTITAGWLYRVGRHPWTWQHAPRVPKVTAEPYYSDDAYVGFV